MVNSVNNFSFSNDRAQMINFPTRIPDCDSGSPTLLDLFLLIQVFLLHCFPSIKNYCHVVVSVSIDVSSKLMV